MNDPLTDIADDVHALVDPYHHVEPYNIVDGGKVKPRHHMTKHPSLLDQLRAAEQHAGNDGTSGGYESRPAARLEAIATLNTIDSEVATWITWRRRTVRGTTEANLRAIVGIATDLGPDDRRELAGEVRRWYSTM